MGRAGSMVVRICGKCKTVLTLEWKKWKKWTVTVMIGDKSLVMMKREKESEGGERL